MSNNSNNTKTKKHNVLANSRTYKFTFHTTAWIARLLIVVCSISSISLLFQINIFAIPNLFTVIFIAIIFSPILILIALFIDYVLNKQFPMLTLVLLLIGIIIFMVILTLGVKVVV